MSKIYKKKKEQIFIPSQPKHKTKKVLLTTKINMKKGGKV